MGNRVRRSRAGFSLVELLIVAAILILLSAIGIGFHQGALDSSELNYVMPKVSQNLNSVREVADEFGAKTVFDFPKGKPTMTITITRGEPTKTTELDGSKWLSYPPEYMRLGVRKFLYTCEADFRIVASWDMAEAGLLHRKLRWGKYRYPDGGDTPRNFTFFPQGAPEGGTVKYGSFFARAELALDGDRVTWRMD